MLNTATLSARAHSGAEASTKHLETRLEVILGHAFCDHQKADEGLRITVHVYNVGLRIGNLEGKV